MHKYRLFAFLLLFIFKGSYADIISNELSLDSGSGVLNGTLLTPDTPFTVPVVLIIAGSGPTDRDGNQPHMRNNSLKQLAESLAQQGVASLRYDKRGVAQSRTAVQREQDLRFENYIDDARLWIQRLKQDDRFNQVLVIGHSEGSLIGMVAAQEVGVDGFVSLAGAGQSADKLIKKQLKPHAQLYQQAVPIIEKLVSRNQVSDVPTALDVLFRSSVQPYMISWFQYDPVKEIAKLTVPVLIVQGTSDLQIRIEDAEALAAAKPSAKKVMLPGVNHIFKQVGDANPAQNAKTYNQPSQPISTELVKAITQFIATSKPEN